MTKASLFLAVLLLAVAASPAQGAGTIGCSYKETFKTGGWRHASLTLTLEEGKITAISYNNGIASGKEGGGSLCAFDASAADGKSTWIRKKGRTTVELKGDGPAKFEIREEKKMFTIRFVEMSTEYCGFGAEFPESVRLDRGKPKCRVKF